MIDYAQKVKEHPYRNSADNLLSLLKELQNKFDSLTDDELSTLNRLEEVYNIMLHRIDLADPLFVSRNLLDSLQNQTQVIISNLNSFHQNYKTNVAQKNNDYQKITQSLESIVTQLTQVYFPQNEGELEILKESIVSIRHSLSQHNRYVKEEYSELKKEKEDLQKQIAILKSNVESYSTSVGAKINDLTEQGTAFERMFSEKQQERTKEFTVSQKDWGSQYQEQFNILRTNYDQKIEELKMQFDEFKQSLSEQSTTYKQEVDNQKLELDKLIEVAGAEVMSDGYAKYANKSVWGKWIWQIITMLSLGAFAWAAYSIIPNLEEDRFTWSVFGARLVFALAVGAVSGFSIKQASQYHQSEKSNRDIQLKLASIEPYLKNFEGPERNEIKKQLINEYFSVQQHTNRQVAATQDSNNSNE